MKLKNAVKNSNTNDNVNLTKKRSSRRKSTSIEYTTIGSDKVEGWLFPELGVQDREKRKEPEVNQNNLTLPACQLIDKKFY